MQKPTFDRYHPNYAACTNAVDYADEGDFEKSCVWLNEAQIGLEDEENLQDYEDAVEYILDRAEEAGVDLQRDKRTLRTNWRVG